MDTQILVGAAVGGIVMALALFFHWMLGKMFPRISWRASIGIMIATVLALSLLIGQFA